jgi:hypothetical protein
MSLILQHFDIAKDMKERVAPVREIDPSIIRHNALRDIEVKLFDYREELEEGGMSGQEVDELVDARRREFREDMNLLKPQDSEPVLDPVFAAHLKRAADALGIDPKSEDKPEPEEVSENEVEEVQKEAKESSPRDHEDPRYRRRNEPPNRRRQRCSSRN